MKTGGPGLAATSDPTGAENFDGTKLHNLVVGLHPGQSTTGGGGGDVGATGVVVGGGGDVGATGVVVGGGGDVGTVGATGVVVGGGGGNGVVGGDGVVGKRSGGGGEAASPHGPSWTPGMQKNGS